MGVQESKAKGRDRRRAERQEEYREKLKVNNIIRNLHAINDKYMKIIGPKPPAYLKKVNVHALRDAYKLNLSLLNKFLPDQRELNVALDDAEEIVRVMRIPMGPESLEEWGKMAMESQKKLKEEVRH